MNKNCIYVYIYLKLERVKEFTHACFNTMDYKIKNIKNKLLRSKFDLRVIIRKSRSKESTLTLNPYILLHVNKIMNSLKREKQ